MDNTRRHKNRKNNKVRKPPKVPIKTYRWEDIRRARKRGGYPWTYFYKPPFNEQIDPAQFTMDSLRRTKSASAMGARAEGVEISEVASFPESGKTTPSFLQVELVSEPGDESSAKNSRAGSLIIEEYVEEEDKNTEDDVQVKEFQLESAESSDNISQYLDKEERGPSNSNVKDIDERKNDETDREKPEGTEPPKRKLSAESGHSRYSLSKLGVMKKLREAKTKIKVPKLTFPTRKPPRNGSPPKETKKTKKETKKDSKHTSDPTKLRADKPVYIHIPLRPPEGVTDEFSHLEFEPKKENGVDSAKKNEEKEEIQPKKPSVTRKPPIKINPAFKQLLKDVRQLKEKEDSEKCLKIDEPKEEELTVKPEEPIADKLKEAESAVKLEEVTVEKSKEEDSTVKPEESTVESPLKTEKVDEETLKQIPRVKSETSILNEEEKEVSSIENQALDEEEQLDLEEQQTSDAESTKDDPFDKLFKSSTKDTPEMNDEAGTSRDVRSRSAEPQRKRKSSIESSYSRKSLSKIGILKKLKEASEKIKGAFSLGSLKTAEAKNPPKEEVKHKKPKPTAVVKPGQLEGPKHTEPVYIHIPLKPPEGQTDEFSYLEFHSTGPSKPVEKKEERTDSLDSTSPISPKNSDIHFIFLTPPSDDEILDEQGSEIPETPSSEDIVFFGSLKKLAKEVVDEVSPEAIRKGLETVSEENSAEKGSNSDLESLSVKNETPEDIVDDERSNGEHQTEKMIVDEEDGLNELTKSEELKSALKSEGPTLKKKVSFKRKAKSDKPDDQKDNGYEPIAVPKKEEPEGKEGEKTEPESGRKLLASDINQSMSVDEEKSYLDQKIVKETSLEEDYNKWSKSGDHEYELINPPDEVTVFSPEVTVIETNHEPKVVISATEILESPPEEKKKSFFSFGRFQKEKTPAQEEIEDDRSEHLPEMEEVKPADGPNKFQAAFKHKTEQLKNKTNELCSRMRNIKKPSINMPKAPEFKKPQFKKPDFKRFKIEKPKISLNLPKIPDTATIHLPSLGLSGSKKNIEKQTVETRQLSTESNAGDSDTKKRSKFEFNFGSTFPRFKKKKRPQGDEAVFATVPRLKKQSKSAQEPAEPVRISLHSEDSEERWESDGENVAPRSGFEDRETSTDIERSSRGRFDKEIAVEDEYERENQEINRAEFLSRWQHGNFSKTEPDDRDDERIVEQLIEERFKRVGARYGQNNESEPTYIDEEVEEEYNYNERPSRELITDLDNLDEDEAGQIKDGYSSEGSEGLQKKGRLGKLDIDSDEFFVVHEIREGFQTPANALAQMNEYDPIGSNRSLPQPVIEKRAPIKKPKRKKTPHVSQEHIPGDEESIEELVPPARPKRRSKKGKKHFVEPVVPYQETISLEEEEHGQRLKFPRESLGILGDDEGDFEDYDDKFRDSGSFREMENISEEPSVPPRKHRSLKSLTVSENDSLLTDNRHVNIEDYIIPAEEPPSKPRRRSRSHTSSLSRISLPPSQRDVDSLLADEAYLAENQPVPGYLVERPYQRSHESGKQQARSYLEDEDQPLRPCAEEPCVQDIRDYMGYAIVDKNKPPREPPLPPPRTMPRRRKRQTEEKFASLPLHSQPTRPLRNYSTIGQAKNRIDKENFYENDGENKENEVDIRQYMEIDDDINKDLVSGEVVQKMRQRPLPAPPRPPRKPRTFRKSLQDITSKENIVSSIDAPEAFKTVHVEEESTSPVPESPPVSEFQEPPAREIKLISPSVYSYEETVTHGSLLVEPLNGVKVLPDSELSSRERLIPITRDYSDEEISEIPESFKTLKSPDEVVKAETPQIQELDVDRLRVNELLANRIVVSELDASSILTDDLHNKSGVPLRVGEIQLPQKLLEEVVRKLEEREQKKTSPLDVEPPKPPQRTNSLSSDSSPEPPRPPPRSYVTEDIVEEETIPVSSPVEHEVQSEIVTEPIPEMLEPEIDDQPPPRPPEPAEGLYFPSQPPPSFYALRAKQYVDGLEGENIPTVPRRKRRPRSISRPMSRSRSTSDESDLAHGRTRGSRRFSDPSIPELTGRLIQACGSRANNAMKRLIYHLTENVLRNADGQQDLHVIMIILLVLIAGLILLGYGEDRTVVHLHHWEYFNPPKDI